MHTFFLGGGDGNFVGHIKGEQSPCQCSWLHILMSILVEWGPSCASIFCTIGMLRFFTLWYLWWAVEKVGARPSDDKLVCFFLKCPLVSKLPLERRQFDNSCAVRMRVCPLLGGWHPSCRWSHRLAARESRLWSRREHRGHQTIHSHSPASPSPPKISTKIFFQPSKLRWPQSLVLPIGSA